MLVIQYKHPPNRRPWGSDLSLNGAKYFFKKLPLLVALLSTICKIVQLEAAENESLKYFWKVYCYK